MFITPAFAQAPGGDPFGGVGGLLFPMLIMIVIFYFLVIRPQQQRSKAHRELVNQVRRGDTVITSGGFIGKVTKASDTLHWKYTFGESSPVCLSISIVMTGKCLPATIFDRMVADEMSK